MTSSTNLSTILLTNDLSTNDFEKAIQLKHLRSQCVQMIKAIDKLEEGMYEHLSSLEDDKYMVEPVFDSKKTSVLDSELFAEELPENYKNALQMSTSDIVKLLGKERLRQLVIDTVGWEVFEENANVGITDARKNIPKAMQNRYIKEEYRRVGYVVKEK